MKKFQKITKEKNDKNGLYYNKPKETFVFLNAALRSTKLSLIIPAGYSGIIPVGFPV